MSEQQPKPKSTKKPAPKSTNAEVNQRVSEIKDLLLQGQTRSAILRYAQKWGVVDNQVDRYMATATAEIKEVVQSESANDISILTANLP